MANQEIKLTTNQSSILNRVLDKNNIAYNQRHVDDDYVILSISPMEIDKAFDALTDQIGLIGIDKNSGDLNTQGKLLDEIAGIFAKIKYS